MNTLLQHFRTAILSTLVLTVILCGLYPLVVWGLAQTLFPRQANGSLIILDGKLIGSALIGQPFSGPQYFHPRPSAAGSGYDAALSGGSNLGPLSRTLIETVEQRIEAYRKENTLSRTTPIPADAVTASASGLDPHISVYNTRLQLPRVVKARGVDEAAVRRLVDQYTERPDLGILGEPRVNVLMLNLALDRQR